MTLVPMQRKVLQVNDQLAAEIRRRLAERRIFCLNFVSSPGSGKTSLLERTIRDLSREIRMGLMAGDVQTEHDANRLKAAGGTMVQPITTGGLCHLDANLVTMALAKIDLEAIDLLLIENVGNLVCPSSYDLGEDAKVVIMSVTEGDDKPLKYPGMFRRSSLLLINKIDLLPYCRFDVAAAETNARKVNGALDSFRLSCVSGDGLAGWYGWLRDRIAEKKNRPVTN